MKVDLKTMISFNDKDEAFRFYTANIDGVIRESVDLLLTKGRKNDISEEVALYKLSMLNRVQLFQAAVKSKNADAIDQASQLLQDGLRGVADMVRIQAQLEQLSKDKYTLEQVEKLINDFIEVVFLVCNAHDKPEIADQIENQLRKQTEITLRPRGVQFTPADDVLMMDTSIPRISND